MATPVKEQHLSVQATAHAGELGTLPDIDPSKLTIELSTSLKPIPAPESLIFGQTTTDHMLEMNFSPESGWSAPVIKPYGHIALDPACSVFHYTPALFEGMKAFVGPDGVARLFRPDLNMKRMISSADRVALPSFDADALLVLIKKLVVVDKRWIPDQPGYSMYIRPTLIGTKPSLGVSASTHAKLYVILSPTGPYFPTGFNPISLFAEFDTVRSWPGGTGAFKLGINYTPTFKPQREAAKLGYQQILWVLGEGREGRWVTEAGQMNFFAVVERSDGDLDVITPPLDGTILPGVTRSSVLGLCKAFNTHPDLFTQFRSSPALVASATKLKHDAGTVPSTSSSPSLPPVDLPSTTTTTITTTSTAFPKFHAREEQIKLIDIERLTASGTLVEAFGAGTAAVVCPIGRIGVKNDVSGQVEDIVLPEYEGGMGPVAGAMYRALVALYEGRVEWEGWSVACQ